MAEPGRSALSRRRTRDLAGLVLMVLGLIGTVLFAFEMSTLGGLIVLSLACFAAGVVLCVDV